MKKLMRKFQWALDHADDPRAVLFFITFDYSVLP